MKNYLIFAAIAAALVLLALFSMSRRAPTIPPDSPLLAVPGASPSNQPQAANPDLEPFTPVAISEASTNEDTDFGQLVRKGKEAANIPVQFYGLVLDQDGNALQNVSVDVALVEQIVDSSPEDKMKRTHLQRRSGADGRFEITGLKAWVVIVHTLAKEGYEPEFPHAYGAYGAQSGSLNDPVLFRMWSTNMHAPLIAGEKSFLVIPDGRRYAIDIVKGTIAEGADGDLVAWIKRPQGVTWGQRYDWSCELSVPGGGLLGSQDRSMFIAPEATYTNGFSCQQQAGTSGWGDGTGEKRFYVKLRNGQMFGRMTVELYAYYNEENPARIRLSYAVNPSGSRLLR